MSGEVKYISMDGAIYNPDSCAPLEYAWKQKDIEMQTLVRGTYPGYLLQKNELKGMKSIGYWNANKLQSWGLDWHRNEGIEICFLESGDLEFNLEDKTYKLVPNTLTITRPWIPHKLGSPNIGLCKLHWFILDVNVRQPHQEWVWPDWIILSKKNLDELTQILRLNEQPVWQVNDEIKHCFTRIGKIVKHYETEHYDTKIKIYINELLILLLDTFKRDKLVLNNALIESKRSVSIFLKTLEDDLANNWTVNKMAEHCGLGVTQFSKHCYELTNCTPINYLNKLRLRRAEKIITENMDTTITSVAFDCGFSSNQYFTKVFKAHYHKTPLQFREESLINN